MNVFRLLLFWFGLLAATAAKAQFGPSGPPAPGPLHIIVGGPNFAGCITGAVAMPPRGDGYQTIHSSVSHFYGAPVTVQGVIALGQKARENGLPPLLVEDISLPRGGPMPGGHASHQVGLDVDIALDMRMRGYLSEADRESIQIASLVRPDGRDILPSMWGRSTTRLVAMAGGDAARGGSGAGQCGDQTTALPHCGRRPDLAALRPPLV